MKSSVFIIIFALKFHLNFALPPRQGIILYASVFKNSAKAVTGDFFKQPDSVFHLVQYDLRNSISFFNTSRKGLKQISVQTSESYSVQHLDSDFVIKKRCNTYYKFPLHFAKLYKTNASISFIGITCVKYYSVNEFLDTTEYYLTKDLPKTAGVVFFSNVTECIIGMEDKLVKTFPVGIENPRKQLTYIPVNKLQEIKSTKEVWINGISAGIKEGNFFPQFKAIDINRKIINNDSLRSNYSIFIVFNNIKQCKNTSDPKIAEMIDGYNEGNQELLNALNEIAREKKANGYVITGDYYESFSNTSYKYLHIVPNGENWKQKVQIYSSPEIVVTNKSGIVIKYGSIIDLNPAISMKNGLIEFLQ